MHVDHRWMDTLQESQLNLAIKFSTPYTCLRLSQLSRSAAELFEDSPVLFWLLTNYSLYENWREKTFIKAISMKRPEILGEVCGCTEIPTKSALKFINRFSGGKLQNDADREIITEWVRTGKFEQLRHYQILSTGLLRLFDQSPGLIGAKWTFSIKKDGVEIQEYKIFIKDSLNMAREMGYLDRIEKDFFNLKAISEVQELHDILLSRYLEHLYAVRGRELRNSYKLPVLEFPAPPIKGTSSIIPITDSYMLYEEGLLQRNCAYSYLDEILSGHYYLYRVQSHDRATLGVNLRQGKDIKMDQLLAADNSEVSSKTVNLVNHWLNSPKNESLSIMADYKQRRVDEDMSSYMEYQQQIP